MKSGIRIIRILVMLLLCFSWTYLTGFRVQHQIVEERQRLNEVERELEKYREFAEQRNQIRSYYESQNDRVIRAGFRELAEELEEAYINEDILAIEQTHLKIKYLYTNISTVEDQYYFYDALFDYLNGNIDQTLEKMRYVIDNHPNSEKIRQAVNFAQTIHIVRDLNREYIDLYHRFPRLTTSRSHYWLGHAYYNLVDYEKSVESFEELKNDPDFGFRSQLMLGMIAFAEFDSEKAIRVFARTVENYKEDEPYYDFALLSLARIYANFKFFESALLTYDEYRLFMGANIEPEVIYEMALVAEEAGRDELAVELLRQIINLPFTSHIFDKALSRLAIISAKEDISTARQLVDDLLENNNSYKNLMSLRNERLESVRNHVDFMLDDSVEDRDAKLKELDGLFDKVNTIKERQKQIGDFGVDKQELEVIDFITEEYSALIKTVAEMSALIDRVAEQPNDKRVKTIDNYISDMDSLKVDLLSMIFLSNESIDEIPEWNRILRPSGFRRRLIVMTEINEHILGQHQQARRLARDIVAYKNLLSSRKDSDGFEEEEQSSIREVIDLAYEEAETYFDVIDYEDEYVSQLKEEFDSLTSVRKQLVHIRELVAEQYHQSLAERLRQANKYMFEDSDDIFTFSVNRINNFIHDLEDMNLEYNYAVLEVQFREALNMDREYSRIRQLMLEEPDDENSEEVNHEEQ